MLSLPKPRCRILNLLLVLICFICAGSLQAAPLPTEDKAEEAPRITEVLAASGFKSFASILVASGILDELGENNFTCFAPTDEAIAAMPAAELKGMQDDPKGKNTLRWIKYHFIKSEVCRKSDLGIVREIITWAALPSYLSITPTKMWLNDGSNIMKFDLPVKNGVIHSISKALDPRDYERKGDETK